MADEATMEVNPAALEAALDSSAEIKSQETVIAQPEGEKPGQDALDEKGVPLKNREAEAARKARKAQEAERQLITPAVVPEQKVDDPNELLQALTLVANQAVEAKLAPIKVRQFLHDNPGASDLIEDINRIRAIHPEIGGVDQLEIAYKVALAERQDEVIRKQVEAQTKEEVQTLEQSKKAHVEGTGRSSNPQTSLDQRVADASLKDLRELESLLPHA